MTPPNLARTVSTNLLMKDQASYTFYSPCDRAESQSLLSLCHSAAVRGDKSILKKHSQTLELRPRKKSVLLYVAQTCPASYTMPHRNLSFRSMCTGRICCIYEGINQQSLATIKSRTHAYGGWTGLSALVPGISMWRLHASHTENY